MQQKKEALSPLNGKSASLPNNLFLFVFYLIVKLPELTLPRTGTPVA